MRQKLLVAVVIGGLAAAMVAVPHLIRGRGGPRTNAARLGVTSTAARQPARRPAPSVLVPRPVRVPGPPTYRFTTVTFAGSIDAQISAINNAGAYTGNVVGKSGNRPFVVAAPGAEPVYFQLPYAAVPSSVTTAGIDTAGGVAGTFVDRRGVFHGFLRSAGGRYRQLDIAGAGTARGEGTEVAGMSAGGVVVGNYLTSANVATGFIDRVGRISSLIERSAGTEPGEGTAVEFYSARGGYGGVYIAASGAAHGWWVVGGRLRVVDDPTAAPPGRHEGTQLVGVDGRGRLYGIESPASGDTSAFSISGGAPAAIRDPMQTAGAGQTLLLGVNAGGDVVGSYTYNAAGRTRAFIGRPTV